MINYKNKKTFMCTYGFKIGVLGPSCTLECFPSTSFHSNLRREKSMEKDEKKNNPTIIDAISFIFSQFS